MQKSFVQAFMDHTQQYESPGSFWKWAAYTCVAAVLRDNVYLEDGNSKLYPNIYVLFLAQSAGRKGRPVHDAEHLVHLVNNVKIISGRASIQAILVEIGQTETDARGVFRKGGAAIFFAPELSAGIVSDDQSIQILTDIYDYKATGHTTNLIGRGKSKLDKLVFSMLAASNEELLKELYSLKAIKGGLLGRTFLIKPDESRPGNAFPTADEKGFLHLVDKLREISLLEGVFKFSEEAKKFYADWYGGFFEAAKKRNDTSGVFGRIHTNVKKLATILSANELSGTIEQRHVEQAIDECLNLIPNYSSFMISSGKSTIAEAGAIVLTELTRKDYVSKKQFIRDFWMHFDPEILDKTITAFEISGLVKTQLAGNEVTYTLTDKGKEIMGKK